MQQRISFHKLYIRKNREKKKEKEKQKASFWALLWYAAEKMPADKTGSWKTVGRQLAFLQWGNLFIEGKLNCRIS